MTITENVKKNARFVIPYV